jgi:hypothetical protein
MVRFSSARLLLFFLLLLIRRGIRWSGPSQQRITFDRIGWNLFFTWSKTQNRLSKTTELFLVLAVHRLHGEDRSTNGNYVAEL